MSPERLAMPFSSVSSAVWPCFSMWTLIPRLLSQVCTFPRSRFACRTIEGRSAAKWLTCAVTGLERTMPITASVAKPDRNVSGIPTGRGTPCRSSHLIGGLSISAVTLANTRIRRTGPAARASSQRARIASGSSTSWIHRGTTTGGTGRPAWAGSDPGAGARSGDPAARSRRRSSIRMLIGLHLIGPSESMAPQRT